MDAPSRSGTTAAALADLEPLAVVAGLDLAAGLRQCGNRVPMYRHMLGRFAELYTQPLPPPTEPQGEPDLPTREWAHSLRGASATVGAVQVQALAARLESLCDDATTTLGDRQEAHKRLATAVDGLVTQLRARLPRPDAPKPR